MVALSQNEEDEDDVAPNAEKLCEDRFDDDYFRLTTKGDCRDVIRCDRAGENGKVRLASIRCPANLAFDIDRQTCDWKTNVKNCDKLES